MESPKENKYKNSLFPSLKCSVLFLSSSLSSLHRLETVVSSAEELGVDSAELLDELSVAGGELCGDAEDERWSQVKSIKSFPNLAEGESGQPVKSQEGIPSSSV